MSWTIELAKKGIGWTSPNPMVGCVIVKDGRVVGKGYHARYGGPHAEIEALKAAGTNARGAVLYTNLEPCSHHSKTPPCTEAIIKAGIKEVHMAMDDPNPLVFGSGKKELEHAGISVIVGECEGEARRLNEVFVKYITSGRLYVVVKWAMTLDGKIATHTGESKWITGEDARRCAHELRHQYDAVMVGVNTVIKDDPELMVRHGIEDPRHPLRVIVDSEGRTPLTARVLDSTLPGKTIIVTTEKMSIKREQDYVQQRVEVMRMNTIPLSIEILLQELGKRKIASVMIEGGGELTWSALEAGVVDKAYIFMGSKIIGGRDAKTPVEGKGVEKMIEAFSWRIEQVKRYGQDVLIEAYPHKNQDV